VGMRDARWYGSRLLPLAGLAAFAIVARQNPSFATSMIVCVVGIAVMATIARGTFVSGGQAVWEPAVSRVALGLSSSVALLLLSSALAVGSPVLLLVSSAIRADSSP